MNILEQFSLKGKNALITCPEYPYGKEIAAGLCSAGACVYLAGPNAEAMNQLAASLKESGTPVSGCYAYEPGTEAAAVALADTIKKDLNTLDILVENSTGLRKEGWSHSFEDIYEILQFAQLGVMLTVQKLG